MSPHFKFFALMTICLCLLVMAGTIEYNTLHEEKKVHVKEKKGVQVVPKPRCRYADC